MHDIVCTGKMLHTCNKGTEVIHRAPTARQDMMSCFGGSAWRSTELDGSSSAAYCLTKSHQIIKLSSIILQVNKLALAVWTEEEETSCLSTHDR